MTYLQGGAALRRSLPGELGASETISQDPLSPLFSFLCTITRQARVRGLRLVPRKFIPRQGHIFSSWLSCEPGDSEKLDDTWTASRRPFLS
jgi:hypothetical protein